MPKNAIQHIEWTTRDPQRLMDFFNRIFDWNFFEAMPGYTMIEGVGGVFEAPDPQMPVTITPYVNVADLELIEDRVEAAGGQVHKSKQEVPGRGWFSLVSDPDGNLLGLWEALASSPATAAPRKRAAKEAASKKAVKKAAKKAVKKTAKKTARRAAKKGAGKRSRR